MVPGNTVSVSQTSMPSLPLPLRDGVGHGVSGEKSFHSGARNW